MEKPQMISIAGLKARGWTQAFITPPWGTGYGKAQFSLCEISAYAPLRHRKSSFLRGVVRVSCCRKLLGVSAEQRLPWRQSARLSVATRAHREPRHARHG